MTGPSFKLTVVMARIARVVPEVSLDRAFDYEIPAELDAQVALGAKVRIPFGSREIVGYVVEFPVEPSERVLKPIVEVLGQRSFLPAILIELAQWIAQYYAAPLAVAPSTPMASRTTAARDAPMRRWRGRRS